MCSVLPPDPKGWEILGFGKLHPESATASDVVTLRLLCLRHLKRSIGYSEETEELPKHARTGTPEVKDIPELSGDSDNDTLSRSTTFEISE